MAYQGAGLDTETLENLRDEALHDADMQRLLWQNWRLRASHIIRVLLEPIRLNLSEQAVHIKKIMDSDVNQEKREWLQDSLLDTLDCIARLDELWGLANQNIYPPAVICRVVTDAIISDPLDARMIMESAAQAWIEHIDCERDHIRIFCSDRPDRDRLLSELKKDRRLFVRLKRLSRCLDKQKAKENKA